MHASSVTRAALAALLLAGATAQAADEPAGKAGTMFHVRIENVSKPDTLKTSTGMTPPAAVSPGLWVVHTGPAPLFKTGEKDRGKGLERIAEEGNPAMLAGSIPAMKGIVSHGVFNTPVGASEPGPIVSGLAYEFTVSATPGQKLSFAMMFGQSNDLFYGPAEEGIALFDAQGRPQSGDVTGAIALWDAGTEVNQEPGAGADQAPRQPAPNTGADEQGTVRRIERVKDGFTYPSVAGVLRITITAPGPTM